MIVWAIANQKGGVGKTTTAVTLAGLLAQRGLRTLMVDMDPHGSLTSYFGLDPDSLENSVYQLFQGDVGRESANALVRQTRFDYLSLMPASTALVTLDRQLGAQGGKGLILHKGLSLIADRFDHVLIDCPPLLGVLMVNALAACHRLLVPVQTEFLALKGLERMLHTIEMIGKARKPELPYTIIPTLFDRRTRASWDSLNALREQYPKRLWNGAIPVDSTFREASSRGMPLSLLHPRARGALAYEALLNTLVKGGA